MYSAPRLSPPCTANDILESCFRVLWPYHSHPHSQRTESENLSFFISALHIAHDLIHIALLHDAANRTHQLQPICRVTWEQVRSRVLCVYVWPPPMPAFETSFRRLWNV